MTDELVNHPVLPTWPTPPARILMDECSRLKKFAEDNKISLTNYLPYTEIVDDIFNEHRKWRQSVANPTKEQEDEIRINVPYRSYGGPVAKPSTFWKLFAIFQFAVIAIYLFVKLIKG